MTKGEKCKAAREAVENLRKALKAETHLDLVEVLTKQLHRAQAKLAELTGSTEP